MDVLFEVGGLQLLLNLCKICDSHLWVFSLIQNLSQKLSTFPEKIQNHFLELATQYANAIAIMDFATCDEVLLAHFLETLATLSVSRLITERIRQTLSTRKCSEILHTWTKQRITSPDIQGIVVSQSLQLICFLEGKVNKTSNHKSKN